MQRQTPPASRFFLSDWVRSARPRPDVWDLIDNQVMPLRGTGTFDVDLVGVARARRRRKTGPLVYGRESLFVAPTSAKIPDPAVVPVTVSGKVWVPLLPAGSYEAAP